MSAFDEVTLKWNGASYVIMPNRMMSAIARIEDHVTFGDLQQAHMRGTGMPLAKLAAAFASVLRFAGAPFTEATAENVYVAMFEDGANTANVESAIQILMGMMVPNTKPKKDDAQGNSQADTTKKSSKKHSR